jgi:hypothetical protein
MSVKGIRRVSVRYDRKEGEFTMRCDSCAGSGRSKAYWPISTEFWDVRSGLQKCRACINAERRLSRRQTIEERRAKQRAYYRAHIKQRKAWRDAYRAEHRDEINTKRRIKYAEGREAPKGTTLWEVE